MAVVAEPMQTRGPDFGEPLIKLVSALWENNAVRRVAYAVGDGALYVWVFLDDGSADSLERAVEAEREFRSGAGRPAVEIQFFVLGEIDDANLPTGKIVFERL